MSINEAMIFAAGFGNRMLPLTKLKPKPLLKILGKSIIEHQIEKLIDLKFKNIVINAHYLSDKIISSTMKFKPVVKVIVEKKILETGGGFRNALIKKKFFNIEEPKLLINGDIFWMDTKYPSIKLLIDGWNKNKMDILLSLKKKKEFFGYNGDGDFDLVNPRQKISKINKKNDKPENVFTGLQIAKPSLVLNNGNQNFSMKQIFFSLIKKEQIYGLSDQNPFYHIGTPDDFSKIKDKLIK